MYVKRKREEDEIHLITVTTGTSTKDPCRFMVEERAQRMGTGQAKKAKDNDTTSENKRTL